MASRPTPSVEQIIEIFKKSEKHSASIGIQRGISYNAIPKYLAVDSIRRHYKTTAKKAEEWLDEVCLPKDSPLLLITTEEDGYVDSVIRANDGTYDWAGPQYPRVRVPLEQEGFKSDVGILFLVLNRFGEHTEKREERVKGGQYWIVLRSTLQTMWEALERQASAERSQREANQIVEREAFLQAHPDSIPLVLGLFRRAGIRATTDSVSWRQYARHDKTFSHLTLELRDDDVDKLASVLRDLGIEPRALRRD